MTKNDFLHKCKDEKNTFILLSIYTFILLFFCSKMSPLYPLNEWMDPNIYFNVGKSMFNGRTLYTEAFDHKGPLIFILYGIGYLISTDSFLGVFLIEVIFWIVMSWAVYLTAKIYVNRYYSILAACIFPLFLFKHFGTGGSAEEFILVLQVISLYFFIKYFSKDNKCHPPSFMLIHGIMSSAALLIKLNLVIFWFFPLLGIFCSLLYYRNYRNFFLNILYYISGAGIILLPVFLYFLLNNSFGTFYEVYVVINRKYASIPDNFISIISLFGKRIYDLLRSDFLGSLLIITGAFYFPIKYIPTFTGKVCMVLSGLSVFIIIFITRSFFGYYLLPLYTFSILGWICILKIFQQYIIYTPSKKIIIVTTLIFLLYGIGLKNFYHIGGHEAFKRDTDGTINSRFSKIIGQEENPSLLLLGAGDANSIFTKMNIVPEITYFMTTNLPHYLYPDVRREQTKYIENKEVGFIILTNIFENYDYFHTLPAMKENYLPVDTFIDYKTPFWKPHLKNEIDFYYTYYLYKRKD